MTADSPLKLDERTENLILWLANRSKRVGTPDVVNALRTRIRELVNEARSEGANAMWTEIDTRGLPCD